MPGYLIRQAAYSTKDDYEKMRRMRITVMGTFGDNDYDKYTSTNPGSSRKHRGGQARVVGNNDRGDNPTAVGITTTSYLGDGEPGKLYLEDLDDFRIRIQAELAPLKNTLFKGGAVIIPTFNEAEVTKSEASWKSVGGHTLGSGTAAGSFTAEHARIIEEEIADMIKITDAQEVFLLDGTTKFSDLAELSREPKSMSVDDFLDKPAAGGGGYGEAPRTSTAPEYPTFLHNDLYKFFKKIGVKEDKLEDRRSLAEIMKGLYRGEESSIIEILDIFDNDIDFLLESLESMYDQGTPICSLEIFNMMKGYVIDHYNKTILEDLPPSTTVLEGKSTMVYQTEFSEKNDLLRGLELRGKGDSKGVVMITLIGDRHSLINRESDVTRGYDGQASVMEDGIIDSRDGIKYDLDRYPEECPAVFGITTSHRIGGKNSLKLMTAEKYREVVRKDLIKLFTKVQEQKRMGHQVVIVIPRLDESHDEGSLAHNFGRGGADLPKTHLKVIAEELDWFKRMTESNVVNKTSGKAIDIAESMHRDLSSRSREGTFATRYSRPLAGMGSGSRH